MEGAAKADYEEALNEVHYIINKYSDSNIIWTSDINVTKCQPKSITNDAKFNKFCAENYLQISPHMPSLSTFYHFNRKSSSNIDLFIQRISNETISSIKVITRDPFNTSPHDPVTATVFTTFPPNNSSSKAAYSKGAQRVRWDKVDKVENKVFTEMGWYYS